MFAYAALGCIMALGFCSPVLACKCDFLAASTPPLTGSGTHGRSMKKLEERRVELNSCVQDARAHPVAFVPTHNWASQKEAPQASSRYSGAGAFTSVSLLPVQLCPAMRAPMFITALLVSFGRFSGAGISLCHHLIAGCAQAASTCG